MNTQELQKWGHNLYHDLIEKYKVWSRNEYIRKNEEKDHRANPNPVLDQLYVNIRS